MRRLAALWFPRCSVRQVLFYGFPLFCGCELVDGTLRDSACTCLPNITLARLCWFTAPNRYYNNRSAQGQSTHGRPLHSTSKSLKDHGPCCTGARYSQVVASAFGRLVVPIATPGLHNPDAGSSLDPLADQYALERGLLRPNSIILPRLLACQAS